MALERLFLFSCLLPRIKHSRVAPVAVEASGNYYTTDTTRNFVMYNDCNFSVTLYLLRNVVC